MSALQSQTPQQVCENILVEKKHYNIEHCILPSENAVVDHLLARRLELRDAYEELYNTLQGHSRALEIFLDLVLRTATSWHPEKIQESRADRDELESVNQQIAKHASELAALLEERSELHNTSSFTSDTHYHVCHVIEAASEHNQRFTYYVKDGLKALTSRFDLKYWPSLSEFVQILASDAQNAVIEPTDPMTAAATASERSSKADFFRAMFAGIEEISDENYGQLPPNFRLTDRTLAALGNCALNLASDDLVDEGYVKRLRQRERTRTK